MEYEGTVYRPPSEARSLIIQLTIGCARNTCTFCTMYKDKHFRIRELAEVETDLIEMSRLYPGVRRIFLADGDALIVKTKDLLYILDKIHQLFPTVERVTMYGAPADVLAKTDEELAQLHQAGLEMVYIGAESGDDEVLKFIRKGVTSAQVIEACQRLQKAGIKTSVTLIIGLGGVIRTESHALACAKLISAAKPEYASFLALEVFPGTPLYEQIKRGEFTLLSAKQCVQEMRLFLQNVDSEGTVFRSNHASNYVYLAGDLNRDIPAMLKQLEEADRHASYTPESWRSL